MSQAAKNNWYILRTAFRAERDVKHQLGSLGIECWLPLHSTSRVWSETTRVVNIPLYPSFLMVHCSEETVMGLSGKVEGKARVLFYEGKPVILQEARIDAVQELLTLVSGDKV